MSKPEIQTTDNNDGTDTRKNLVKAAIVIGTHLVLPVVLTTAAIVIAKKLDAKSE